MFVPMFDVFRAEFGRFRRWGLAAMLCHGAWIAFYVRVIDPLQQPIEVYQAFAIAAYLVGMLLGAYQFGSYRKPNMWLVLLHRPLAPRKTASALLGAGSAWLMVAVFVPLALMVVGQEHFSAKVVDLRHYLLPSAALVTGLLGYVSGCYAMLAPARYSAHIVLFAGLLLASNAASLPMLVLMLLCLGHVLLLTLDAFKPDLSAAPRHPASLAATFAALAMTAHLLLVGLGGLTVQLVWIATGTHPLNGGARPGSFIFASRSTANALIDAGLAASEDPRVPHWRSQAHISEPITLRAQFNTMPLRHEMANPAPLEFDDEERRLRYAFSHDDMRFHGRSLVDQSLQPALGMDAQQSRFESVPLPVGDLVIAGHRLLQYDSARQCLDLRIELARDERIIGTPELRGDSVFLLSDQALYLFDALPWQREASLLSVRQRIPLPPPALELDRVDLVETLDGYLVSILWGREAVDKPGNHYQRLLSVDANAVVSTIAHRDLSADFPLLLRHLGLLASPSLEASYQAWTRVLAPAPLLGVRVAKPDRGMQRIGWSLMLIAGIAALLWSRRHYPWPQSLLWAAAVACTGLPGLLALMLLRPVPTTAERVTARLTVRAA